MKLSTVFVASACILGAVLLVAALSVVIVNQQVQEAHQQDALADTIEREAYELSYLGNDYLLYLESQQASRWETKFASFAQHVSELQADAPQSRGLVDRIRTNGQRLQAVFAEIKGHASASPPQDGVIEGAFLEVSWSRMEVQNQGIISDASRLSGILRGQQEQWQQAANHFNFALIGLCGLFLLTTYGFVFRRTLTAIQALQKGTRIVVEGNLDYAIPVTTADEIGELTRSFNQMTANLKLVTASKQDLEREMKERQQAEEARRESDKKYRAIVETAGEGILLARPEGRYFFVNQKMADMLGYPINELLGKSSTDLGFDNGHPQVQLDQANLAQGQVTTGEFKFRRKDGSVLWTSYNESPMFDETGRHLANLGMYTDITERKQVEATLQAVHRRTREILESIQDGFFALDRDWRFTYINPRAAMHAHETPEELVGRNLWNKFPGILGSPQETNFRKAMEEGVPVHFEMEGLLSPGVFDIRVYPSTEGISVYWLDVTERKRMEQELQSLNRSLQGQKMDLETTNHELEAFAYSISHDLRTPLVSIELFARLLLQDHISELSVEAQAFARLIHDHAQAMEQLVQALLEFSRLTRQPLKTEKVEPAALARAVINDLQPECEGRQIEIVVGDLPACEADPVLLKQVYANLLSNALKYTRSRAIARIEVGCECSGRPEPAYWVKDNGIGFDMQQADKLFGVFKRLHAAEDYEGNGVGLAIVQRIIRRHRGRVWAEAKVDEGATFYFTLG